jgi:Family of unknown function (DUF5906)/Bifunctional DNA primase/polymerase, N-terminal
MDGVNMSGIAAATSATASGPDPKARLDELRIALHRNGYHPTPVISHDQPVKRPGKQPAIPRWQKAVADEAEIAGWSDQGGSRTAANTGLLTGDIAGIDIDVPDAALVAEVRALVESVLGPTPLVRFGATPKSLLVYRVAIPAVPVMTKIMTPELFLADGTKLQVEVLGQGQQFVGFGIHPDTKQPYRWEGTTPLDVPMSDLPMVTRDQLLDLVAAAKELLRARGALTKQERAGTHTKKKGARGRTSGGGAAAEVDDGKDFFRHVNREALANIGAWARVIFPTGHFEKGTGAFRVSSADLGRALQEDLSIHPEHGARDFGEETSCSPIDIVVRYGGEAGVIDKVDALTGQTDVLTAAIWLCERLGIDPVTLGYRPERREVTALIAEFNERHMVVVEAGNTLVCTESYDPVLERPVYARSRFQDFERLYQNRRILVSEDTRGKPNYQPAGTVWLNHPNRRQYPGGVVCDPSGQQRDGVLNTWQGFAVKPEPGKWDLLQQHLCWVVCDGDLEAYGYFMNWLARLVQKPAEPGEVAIVMCGTEGSGKGLVAKMVMKLFGRHGLPINSADHFVGRFNAHLIETIVLFVDEAFYAGDKKHEGTLKSFITEPVLLFEAKGFTPFPGRNHLHVFMSSNHPWVVPAGLEARRFLVLNVADTKRGNRAYFNAIVRQMEHEGGLGAMLHDLLHRDLIDFEFRDVPKTAGLIQQRKLSLPIPQRWWADVLLRGFVFRSKFGHFYFSEWREEVSTELLFTSYEEYSAKHRDRDPLSRDAFGAFLTAMGGVRKRLPGDTVVGEDQHGPKHHPGRPWGYRLGSLDEARAAFVTETGLTFDWNA